jgi:hypothetical protein
MRIFVESWNPEYGSPYNVDSEDAAPGGVELVEDGDELIFHYTGESPVQEAIAFVDGVRRGDAWLSQEDPETGDAVRGIAGTYCVGSAVADGSRCILEPAVAQRLVVWGSGMTGQLPAVAGGWSWRSISTADSSPDAPLRALQNQMREEEGRVAEALAARGMLTVIDGPLTYVRRYELPVVGYIKTHHRSLLAPPEHRRVGQLSVNERTSLFRLGSDRYSCYLRIGTPSPDAGPWSGIVRLEVPQAVGLEEASEIANRMCATLPRFAGVAHADPRAPQNLQPVGGLESHLRHLMGDARLAIRAVRESVRGLTIEQQENA